MTTDSGIETFDVVVVGGGPSGGAACQTRARREPWPAAATASPSSPKMAVCTPMGVNTRTRRAEVHAAKKVPPAARATGDSPLGNGRIHSTAPDHASSGRHVSMAGTSRPPAPAALARATPAGPRAPRAMEL